MKINQVSSAPRPRAESLVELVRDRADRGAGGWSLGFLCNDTASVAALDHGALDRQARSIAAALQEVTTPGERALLLYPPGPEFLAAFFGCLYAGVLAVPVNVPARNRLFGRVEAVATDAGVAVVLSAAGAGYAARPFIRDSPVLAALPWRLTDEPGLPAPAAWRPRWPAAGDLAFLQYTSGSTGEPRGVMVSHANLMYDLEEMAAVWQVDADSVLVTWLPQFHDLGLIYGLLLPVFAGIPCHAMAPAAFVQRPWRWLAALSRHAATHSAAPNFAYDLCVQKIAPEERHGLDLSRWRMAMNGAEPIRLATLERFTAAFGRQGFAPTAFCPAYGLAEGTLALTANPTGEAPRTLFLDTAELQRGRAATAAGGAAGPGLTPVVGCGAPLPGLDLRIVDPDTGADCPAGRIGEVWVAGPAVAQGYWQRPEETAATFGARRAGGGGTPYLRTGDLGFLHASELYVTGRIKELLVLRGANHYPQDIEAAAQASHPALRLNCGAAFSVEAEGEERLVLVQEIERVHRKAEPGPIFAAIRRAIAEAFDLRVHAIALLEPGALLRTSSGKIQRAANREQFLTGTSGALAVWTAGAATAAGAAAGRHSEKTAAAGRRPDETEAALCRHLCEWLARRTGIPLAEIAPAEPFASCGLDSLGSVELSRDLELLLGRPLPETLAWDHPSPAALAAHLAGRPAAAAPERRPLTAPGEPVAVLGLACRMPGAPDAERFWRLLADGVDAVTEVPPERWDAAAVAAAGPGTSPRWGAFLDDIDLFDAEFFHVPPHEARSMDPQQRLLLEVAWQALEAAGRATPALAGSRTGVFAASGDGEYPLRLRAQGLAALDGLFATGASGSMTAARLSYVLGLRGPSLVVDTACSSSLVALHLAVQSLRRGECDLALAAAVHLMLEPDLTVALARAGLMAADGRSKTFDEAADGYVRGEGCGVLVLKRLADAERDGDPILGVIRGTAVNQDGRTNGLTAPSGAAQCEVIAAALADAGLPPAAVDYVEAHGTGTALGDPIEMRALGEVFAAGRAAGDPLLVGSVKTNIGHLETAAGLAGVIKVLLAMAHGEIPPHLHLQTPSRKIPWAELPLAVPTRRTPWPRRGARQFAGVSSFSFGGTNAHAVLESPPPAPAARPAPAGERPRHLLPLSAPNPAALAPLAAAWADRLAGPAPDAATLADLCFSAGVGRTHFAHRLAVSGTTAAEVAAALRTAPAGGPAAAGRPKIAFLFAGQGAWSAAVGRQLYATQPAFRSALERCDLLLRPVLGGSLVERLYGAAGAVDDTAWAQPALFAVEYALAALWRSWGIEPAAVLGHSLGEYAAGAVAGVFPLADALALVAARGRLMQELPPGAMATVFAAEEEAAAVLAGDLGGLAVAAVNAPGEVVLSGPAPALEAALERLRRAGIGSQRLRVARAFHSPDVEPMLAGLACELERCRPAEPALPWICGRTGAAAGAEVADSAYWLRQAREPVRFAAGLRTLYDLGFRHFLEIGPHRELLACGRRTLPAAETRWLASLARGRDDWEVLLDSLAELYCAGTEVDWAGFDRGYPRRRRPLPGYPFARQSHWIPRPQEARGAAAGGAGTAAELAPGALPSAAPAPPAEAAPMPVVEEVRAELCALFGRVLQVDAPAIPVDAPFMDLGAASLILIDAVGAIERRFGVAVARQRIFRELGTIAALADFVVAERAARPAAPASPAAPAANPPASPATAPTHELAPRPAGPEEALGPRRQAHLDDLVRRYTARTAGSRRSTEASSPALADSRTAAGFRPAIKEMVYPIVVRRAAGAHLWDIDGNRYVDTTMGFGVQLFGHGAPFLAEAVRRQLDLGLHLGPQAELAGEVAGLLCGLTGVERAAFCNSGTEAVMTALRLARTATGRSKIALFAGSYHGHFDGVLVRSGPGPDSWGVPAALGVPAATAGEALVLDYGDPDGALAALRRHGAELAAVLVEPVQSRRPALQPREFLRALRELTRELGIALVFDEVLLGFRIHQRGAQAWADVRADLVTYGKILGGGMPIAAVAGQAAFMDGIDGGSWRFGDASAPTASATFFAGTFCKHPLAMAAARAVLTRLIAEGPGLQERLNDRTARMAAALNGFFAAECPDLAVDHCGSLFRFRSRASHLDLFFHHLVARGIYVWEGRTCFLSTAHADEDVAAIEDAVRESARELRAAGFLAGPERSAAPAVAAPGNGLPLTPGQAALWRAAQMSPEAASAYNQSLAIDLAGPLDLAALRQALEAVVERHEVLRTVLSDDGRRQSFAPRFALVAPLVDLSADAGAGGPEEAAARWQAAASRQPFELAGGPLLRAAVLRLAPARHRLVVLLHHLVTDGRSMEILIGELTAFYGQACAGQPLALPPPRQFCEVAAALAARRCGPGRAADEAYWRTRFAALPPDLELPLDRPRPAARGFAGGRVAVPVPADLLRGLERTAGEAGATLFALYLAGYALLLSRLARQDDLVIAVLADQRPAELRDAMGYCINVLPLRCRVSAATPVRQLLATVQEDLMNALAHRDYPFSDLLRELPGRRDPGRPPLASVALNLDRYDPSPAFSGLTARVLGNADGLVRWDLMWNLVCGPRGTILECDFDRALFDGATVARWAAGYLDILRALAADPEETAAALHARRLPAPPPTVAARIAEQARRRPATPAVRGPGGSLTYGELAARAGRLAGRLVRRGVAPGDRVAVLAEQGGEVITALLACFASGAVFVPLDPEAPAGRLADLLAGCAATLLLAGADVPVPPSPVPCLALAGPEDHGANPLPLDRCPSGPQSLAYLLHTSGSTGRPKGVAATHANLAAYVEALGDRLQLAPADWAVVSTLAADLGYTAVFAALCHGGCLHVLPRALALDPYALAAYLAANPVDGLKIVPTHLAALLHLPDAGRLLPRHWLVLGGDRLEGELVQRVAALQPDLAVYNHYGPTETTVGALVHRVVPDDARDGRPVPIGFPLAGARAYLLDAASAPVADGEAGELHLAGAGVTLGYLGESAQTAERFLPDPFAGLPGERMYRTGDLARRLPDGALEFLRRADDQVKIRGHRVEPGEVESVLRAHPKLRAAAVAVRRRANGEPWLAAYAVPESAVTVEELAAYLAERLPAPMLPAALVLLAALPLSPNGKLDRRALPDPPAPAAAPADPAEAPLAGRLAELWARALGLPGCGVDDDFFALGGDSVVAIEIAAGARRLGLAITPQQIFTAPTVNRLLALAAPAGTAAAADADEPPAGPVALTPVQRAFFAAAPPRPAHWNLSLLLRLRQPLPEGCVASALAALLRHHDALRLRIASEGDERRQAFAAAETSFPLECLDLAGLGEREIAAAVERAADRLHAGLDLAEGPLVRAALVETGAGRPARLILVLHHLAVDAVSLRLLVADLETACRQLAAGEAVRLPAKTTAFSAWAARLAGDAAEGRFRDELGYWRGVLAEDAGAAGLPLDAPAGANREGGTRALQIRLTAAETRALLHGAPAARGGHAQEILLAALAAAFRPWTGRSSLLVELEGHGREPLWEGIDTARTVGWFTTHFPVRLTLPRGMAEDGDLSAAVEAVGATLRAIPNRGLGYGVLRHLVPDEGAPDDGAVRALRALPPPEVSFNYLGQFERTAGAAFEIERFAVGRERDAAAPRRASIAIDALVVDGRLRIEWRWSRELHRSETVRRLAGRHAALLRRLLAPLAGDAAGRPALPADFAAWSREELDELAAELAGGQQAGPRAEVR